MANPAVSHGICDPCLERESVGEVPVLVVSRERVEAIPMLESLLRGAPEIAIVVDRRGKGNGHGRPVADVVDRRGKERRRTPSFFLV
jgi:hypothetical protein